MKQFQEFFRINWIFAQYLIEVYPATSAISMVGWVMIVVRTEFAMKHFLCASWWMAASSSALGEASLHRFAFNIEIDIDCMLII